MYEFKNDTMNNRADLKSSVNFYIEQMEELN